MTRNQVEKAKAMFHLLSKEGDRDIYDELSSQVFWDAAYAIQRAIVLAEAYPSSPVAEGDRDGEL